MSASVSTEQLVQLGLDYQDAESISLRINRLLQSLQPGQAWQAITEQILTPSQPFELHRCVFDACYADWDKASGPPPAWTPTPECIATTNLASAMRDLGIDNYKQLYDWSINNRNEFWAYTIQKLAIKFEGRPASIANDTQGAEHVSWLDRAQLNIVDSCFRAPPEEAAIIYQAEGGGVHRISYRELEVMSNRVANGIVEADFQPGDAVAVCMPMTVESVAIYLGLIRAGCVVVSIADSFAPREIERRINIANAKAVFTQDILLRGGKEIPLYSRIIDANAPMAIVLPELHTLQVELRECDASWQEFLSEKETFSSVICGPDHPTNVLFSSGTTGDPKAIPWSHLTPIKCAADAHFHQNIQPGDVVAWPTNLGWMMGPWLIYASLMNQASVALFYGAPTGRAFGEFIQDAGVNMLGVVPSLVKVWRNSGCMYNLDWSEIKAFSSTGECSEFGDMLFLMSLAHYKPVIEYCGGTEIGGGYLTGTVIQPASPASFSTPALGLEIVILDDKGDEADKGEVFLVPPSIGLSQALLNADHHTVYYEGTPQSPAGQVLRRHGDHLQRLGGGYYQAQGRVDDTMNLGGIKVSCAEIEHVVATIEGIRDAASICVSPAAGGPSQLVVYVVLDTAQDTSVIQLHAAIQTAIRGELNPLFHVHEVVAIDSLPRTASNKVMRRKLRDSYQTGTSTQTPARTG